MSAEHSAAAAIRRFKRYPAYKDTGEGWLGEVPSQWDVKRLKYVAPSIEKRVDPASSDLPFMALENIESWTGRIVEGTLPAPDSEAAQSMATHFEHGDVLFGKLRPYLAKIFGADLEGCCSTELMVLRPNRGLSSRYLEYQLRSGGFIDWVNALTYGTKMPRADPQQVLDVSVALPPLEDQHGIVAFLDRETARIDVLVAKKERLIELLNEKRSVLITRLVTTGLDPNLPMKESGLDAVGRIPAHWQVKPLTKYVVEMSDYRGKTPEKVSAGVFLVTARNVKMGTIDYECSQEFVSTSDYDEIMRRGLPKRGDLLFTTEAPLGNVAIVDREDVALAQRIIRFRLNNQHFDSRFVMAAMMSHYFQLQLQTLATGSTALGLKASKLPMLRVVAPPLSE